jgi:phage-related protein
MKYVLYEVTENHDVVIKLSFENHTYLNAFLEQHTAEKSYEPKFLVLEFDSNEDIEFLSEYQGTEQKSRKYVAKLSE